MKSVSISELRSHGEQINVTSKGVSLATLTPPISQHDVAKEKLRKLATTAIVHDVISPIGDDWDACA